MSGSSRGTPGACPLPARPPTPPASLAPGRAAGRCCAAVLLVGRRAAVGGGLAGGFAGHAIGRPRRGHRRRQAEPFCGAHQAGIVTDTQRQTVLAAFDLTTSDRGDLVGAAAGLDRAGGRAGRRASRSPCRSTPRPAAAGADAYADATGGSTTDDSLEAYGLGPNRLTLTVGFGRSLFVTSRRPGPVRDLRAAPGRAGRPAALRRRRARRRRQRRRPVPAGLRRRPAGGLPRGAQHRPDRPGRGHAALDPARVLARQHRRDAAQPDGVQGRHDELQRPPARPTWTPRCGRDRRARPGCTAAATWSTGGSGSPWSTGTGWRRTCRSR